MDFTKLRTLEYRIQTRRLQRKMDGLNDSNGNQGSGDINRNGRLATFIRNRIVIPLFVLFILALGLFTGGFIIFSDRVTTMAAPDLTEAADGIVVLTGGFSRIEGALDLLKNKRGKRLFISGVHASANLSELQRVTGGDAELFACCVDIDRSALDTIGNAEESVKWARANDYDRIIVVTNNYHIPRTMVELRHASQDIEFIPYPIINSNLRDGDWIARGLVVRVLFVEYVKYLGAVIRSKLPDDLSEATTSLLHRLKA